jgi:pilus assembly protein CpaC
MFVVTPRLVKALTSAATLPTDNHVVPSRSDVMLMGGGEGAAPAPVRGSSIDVTPIPAQGAAPVPAAPAPAASPAPVRASSIEAAPVAARPLPVAGP